MGRRGYPRARLKLKRGNPRGPFDRSSGTKHTQVRLCGPVLEVIRAEMAGKAAATTILRTNNSIYLYKLSQKCS